MTKNIEEAVALLRDDNLEWSSDLQDVRLELAMLLEISANYAMTKFVADGLAKRLLFTGGSFTPNLETR